MVGGEQTDDALLHSLCDLKAAQKNVHRSLIRELLIYEFKLAPKAWETSKTLLQYNNKKVQEILLGFLESHQIGMVKLT